MAVNYFQQGGHGTDTFTGAEIKGFYSYGAASTVSSIRLTSGSAAPTAGYQVTAGKTLYITKVVVNGGSASQFITIGYGDTDIGFSSASDPTNWKGVLGQNHIGATTIRQTPFTAPTADTSVTYNCLVAIPASKYCTITFLNSNAGIYLEGFEI